MKVWIGLVIVLFLVACSKEVPSTPTTQVIEVQNITNQTVVIEPVNAQETALKDPLMELEEKQKTAYAQYSQVQRDIRNLEGGLKKRINIQKLQEELREDYHKRNSLKDSIDKLDKEIQSIRLERRSLQEESDINQALSKFAQDEKDLKVKIADNRFRIDKVREAIQNTASEQVKADLKTKLEELYSDQKDFEAHLEKAYARIEEQQQNLEELRLEDAAKKEETLKEDQKKTLSANIATMEKAIQEKEVQLERIKDEETRKQLLSELNSLAINRGILKEKLEELD